MPTLRPSPQYDNPPMMVPEDAGAMPTMAPMDAGGAEDMESHLPGGTADLESHAGPHMNPMLPAEHGVEETAPQGPPPEGKQRFHNTMADFEHRAEANRADMIGLDPTDPDYTKKLSALQAQHGALTTEKARYQMLHPWGGPESAHPGVMGKIGHVAGEIGQIAGGAVAPGVVQEIPGTQSNLAAKGAAGQAEEKTGVEGEQKAAQIGQEEAATKEAGARIPAIEAGTEHTKQETEDLRNKPAVEPTLLQDYTNAVQDAIKHGQDPTQSPVVQQLADSITGIQKPGAEKTPPHITAQGPDGKPHIMERDPKTGAYSIDRGIAPPSYAQIAPQLQGTKTVELLGADNVLHRFQYNAESGKYDLDMGPAPTGTAAHQIFQAGAIEQLAPKIIADINANREILGNLSSYYKQWLAGTPVSDPKAAELMTELMSFAAMQPALHAFRSTSALDAFEKMVGGLAKDPDSIIASINGLMKTPQAFTGMGKNKGGGTEPFKVPEGAPAAPKADGHKLKDRGKVIAISKGGQWVAP